MPAHLCVASESVRVRHSVNVLVAAAWCTGLADCHSNISVRNNGDLLDAFVDMVIASRAQRIIGTYYSSYSFWIYARPGAADCTCTAHARGARTQHPNSYVTAPQHAVEATVH